MVAVAAAAGNGDTLSHGFVSGRGAHLRAFSRATSTIPFNNNTVSRSAGRCRHPRYQHLLFDHDCAQAPFPAHAQLPQTLRLFFSMRPAGREYHTDRTWNQQ